MERNEMKKLIIIPAFNEEKNLLPLIKSISSLEEEYDYVIVNDGSSDRTKELCGNNNLPVLNLPLNSGIGVAVQTGYKYALEMGYDIAIQIDGDGQHDIQYLNKVIEPIIDDVADVVIGSRFIEKKGFQSSGTRRTGIYIISTLIFICTGHKIKDVTSGFRAANRDFIEIFSNDYSRDYPEPEAIITTRMYGGRIIEVPVVMKERRNGTSSINFSRSFYYMIKVTLAILIKRLSYGIRRENVKK